DLAAEVGDAVLRECADDGGESARAVPDLEPGTCDAGGPIGPELYGRQRKTRGGNSRQGGANQPLWIGKLVIPDRLGKRLPLADIDAGLIAQLANSRIANLP